jgi:hypothetical protein
VFLSAHVLDGLGFSGFLARRLTVADFNAARLHGLWNPAHEVDLQKAIVEARCVDFDVVLKADTKLERTLGNSMVQIFALGRFFLLSTNRQEVLLGCDRDFLGGEPGHSKADAISVLA